jgi:PKD repeat protein
LTEDVTVTASTHFEVSKDGLSFSTSLVFTLAEMANPQTVYVRFTPNASGIGSVAGTITNTSGSASAGVAVSGKEGVVIDKALTLDVVNFNVEWFSITANGPTNEALQLQNLKTFIQTMDADVYALQEIGNQTYSPNTVGGFTKLLNELAPLGYAGMRSPHPYVPSPSYGNDQTAVQGLAFIYKTSVVTNPDFTVVLDGYVPSSYPTDPAKFWASGRYPYMMAADVTINGVSKSIKFINIHAKSGSDADAYTRRIADVQILKEHLDTNYPNDNIILLGDYNDDVDTSINPGNPSSYQGLVDDIADYQVITKSLSEAGLATTYSYPDAIDHVTISNELFNDYIPNSAGREVISGFITNPASTLSDHYPISSRFILTSPCVAPTASFTANTVCFGQNTELSNTSSNTTETTLYAWDINNDGTVEATTANYSFVSAISGSFSVKLTVKNGTCESSVVNSITVNALPTFTFTHTPVSCAGSQDGAITFTAEGGAGSYQYSIDNGTNYLTEATFANLIAGDYTLIIKDGNDCVAIAQIFNLPTVPDVTPPATPTLADATGECAVTVTAPTTTDNCAGEIIGTTSDPLEYTAQGTYQITWTFDDGNGNSTQAVQNVVVDDVTAPVTPVLADATGECAVTVTAPTTTDNCAGTITGTTSDPLDYTAQGTYQITWTFDDGNGNSTTAIQNVVVDDVTTPVTPTLADATGECSLTITAPTTTDNCAGTITGTTSDPLDYTAQGTYQITWTFDDGNGNSTTAIQNVVVNPLTGVSIGSYAPVCKDTPAFALTGSPANGTFSGTGVSNGVFNPCTAGAGSHTITYTYTRESGCTATATTSIQVNDSFCLTCSTPTNVQVANITNTTATLSWNVVAGATHYRLRYRVVGNTNWQLVQVIPNTPYTLTGLTANRTYEFQLRSECCGGRTSGFSPLQVFVTPIDTQTGCGVPLNISTTNITANSATASWTAIASAVNYKLRYRVVGASSWTFINTIPSNTQILNGLTATTNYEYQVRSECGGGVVSTYSGMNYFTTTAGNAGCGVPTNLTVSNISTSGVTFSWTVVGGATNYRLRYRVVGTTTWLYRTTIPTSPFVLNNLLANTSYEYQLRAECSGVNGNYTAIQTFTTANAAGREAVISADLPTVFTIAELYPNPAKGVVKLKIYAPEASVVEVALISVLGVVTTTEKLNTQKGWQEYSLSLQGKAKGVYWVKVVMPAGEIVMKKLLLE